MKLPFIIAVLAALLPSFALGRPVHPMVSACPVLKSSTCLSFEARDQSRLLFQLLDRSSSSFKTRFLHSDGRAETSHVSRMKRAVLLGGRGVKVLGGWSATLPPRSSMAERRFISFSIINERRQRVRHYELILRCLHNTSSCAPERSRRSSAKKLRANFHAIDFVHQAPGFSLPPDTSPNNVIQSVPTYSLTIDADSRFTDLYGEDTADLVAVVLEEIAEIYSSQLGVTLRLDALNIFSDTSSDPVAAEFSSATALLDSYNDYVLNLGVSASDHNHLLTARRGFSGAIGLAYLGTTCSFPSFDAGWSEYSFGFRTFVQTFAHELGHSLGATHDTTDPQGLMSIASSVNVQNPYFSDFSKAEIASFLTSYGTCLNDDSESPLPTPGSVTYPLPGERARNLSLAARAVRRGSAGYVKGKISALRAGVEIANRVIELRKVRGLRLVKTTLTASTGRFSFRISPRGQYYVVDRLARKASPALSF